MQETELYDYWRYYARSRRVFYSAGRRLRVIQAGRFQQGRGPDFRAARFELDGVIYQGDVELHLNPADWYRHQHHLDAAYGNVILHLIATNEAAPPSEVRSQISGCSIITLPLPPPSAISDRFHPATDCRAILKDPSVIKYHLQSLALKRLDLKIAQFQSLLAVLTAEQLFHEYFFRALGYPNNAEAFQQLAQRLDYGFLQFWRQRFAVNEQMIYALYAGQAGFLTDYPDDEFCQKLYHYYRRFKKHLIRPSMSADQWQFARTRPFNHPHFRLAGWVQLLTQHPLLPYAGLWELLAQRLPAGQVWRGLQSYFRLPCTGYWQSHYALQKKSTSGRPCGFFGKARVVEILMNIVVPLFAAQARLAGSVGFYSYLQQLYLFLPHSSAYCGLRHRLPFLSAMQKLWPVQALEQAALYLESNYCLTAACRHCPLERQPDKND